MSNRLISEVQPELEFFLKEHGFEIDSPHRDDCVLHFVRKLPWSEKFRQYVSLLAIVNRPDELVVIVKIGIESLELSRIESASGLAECDENRPVFERFEAPTFLTLIGANLSAIEEGVQSRKSYWEYSPSKLKEETSDLKGRLLVTGLPFLDRYCSLDAIVAACADPDLEDQVYVADPVCYLAIALWYGDRKEEAIEILSEAIVGQLSARARRSINCDPDNEQLTRCRAAKLREFLLESNPR